jgi:hypothetical protein
LQKVYLVERIPQRFADLCTVERLVQMIGPKGELVAQRIIVDQGDTGVRLQQRQQVVGRILHIVDLAGKKRIDRLLAVGHRQPFDAVEVYDLAAGEPRRRVHARPVVVELDVNHLVAWIPFILLEDEWTGAGKVGYLDVGVGIGDPFGHHEGHIGRRLTERKNKQPGLLPEPDREAPLVLSGNGLDE